MKIAAETKFNVGDIVYVADCYYEFYPSQTPYVIKDVDVRISSTSVHVSYIIEQEFSMDVVPEEWIFPTYEECTKWCDEHNKGL